MNSPPEEAVSPAAGELIEAPQVCVVLPTYNEADNLPAMVAALLALPISFLFSPMTSQPFT